MKVLQKLAIKLVALRIERRLTVNELAKLTYINSLILEDIEAAKHELSLGELYRLARFFDMYPDELIADIETSE